MLPKAHRLRRPEQFRTVLRGRRIDPRLRGGRAGGDLLTVHLAQRPDGPAAPRAGLVVATTVGNSVIRHRTSRRLRHVLADRLSDLPERTDLVIRAQPRAATATSTELGRELDRLLPRALRASTAERTST